MAGSKTRGIGTGAAVRRIARPAPPTPAGGTGGVAAPGIADASFQGGSIVAALQRQGGRTATEVLMLAPADIAEHPDNPRESLGDLNGLVASVRDMGVLQPILVLPRREYLAAYPHHADHVGDRSWIAVAGHRRRAAAEQAELDAIPALTRADLANPRSAIRTFLAENVHRQQLAPLEEARAFAMLIELGLNQRAIAADNGVSQGHVSKRLRLLQLSRELQDAVRRTDLSIGDALVLADAPVDDRDAAFLLAQQRDWPMTTAIGHIAQQREAAAHRDKGTASQAGGRGPIGSSDVAANDAPEQVPTSKGRPQKEPRAAASQGSAITALVPAAATEQRADACLRLVRTQPAAARMLEDLTVALLQGLTFTTRAVALAHRWIGDQIGEPQEDADAWRGSVVKRDQSRLAWTLAIASLHLHAADTDQAWTPVDAHLAHQLTRTGWQPSPVELNHLQRAGEWPITRTPAATNETTSPAPDLQEGPDA